MRYSGSNNVESVAESWLEAEISWVELDGGRARFSNTQLKNILRGFLLCITEESLYDLHYIINEKIKSGMKKISNDFLNQ